MTRTHLPRTDSRPEPSGRPAEPAGARFFPALTVKTAAAALLIAGAILLATRHDAGSQAPGAPAGAHMSVADPATLGGARAEQVYRAIRARLARRYAESGDPVTLAYQRWRRFNAAPYRSKAHGRRFVNNYANPAAEGYGRFEAVGALPEGAMVAKDSFVVTESGEVLTGPFFLMEKREAGFNPAARDWLFMMVGADGRLVGITGGAGSDRVRFCGECHARAPAGQDALWLPPNRVRRR